MRKRFFGSFDTLVNEMGAKYVNNERFKPLKDDGKPLWEFKEHAHRLYCHRIPDESGRVTIILLDGCVKQKEGRTKREDAEIQRAIRYYHEFLNER